MKRYWKEWGWLRMNPLEMSKWLLPGLLAGLGGCGLIVELASERRLWQKNSRDFYEEKKRKVPPLGGIPFLFLLIVFILWAKTWYMLPAVLIGLVGTLDDLMKLGINGISRPLKAREKIVLQILIGILGAYLWGRTSSLWEVVWVVVVFMAVVNSTNMTDGIDSLLAMTSIVALLFSMLLLPGYGAVFFMLLGFLIGFLWFNAHPADIFMGDTGAFAIGGVLATIFLRSNMEWYLLLIGIVFVLETLSVILQVVYFKKTGRRIFLMSPIHHHFQKMGWSEPQIVFRFTFFQTLGGMIAVVIAYVVAK